MAGLKIEGDLSQINDKQLEFIKDAIKKQGYENNKVLIEPLGQVGDNYMANVKRIRIEGIEGNNSEKTMVVKIAPQIEVQRQMGRTEGLFCNEHVMYTKVLPKFTQLEESYSIPSQDRLRYPLCYGSSGSAPNEVIILEDLSERDFKMLDRMKPLEEDCIKSILKNMALLHSLAFVMKNKEPQVFDEVKDSFVNIWDENGIEDGMGMLTVMEQNILNILETDVRKNAVKGMLLKSLQSFPKIWKSDRNDKHSIIQHGDAWTNNFMFHYDDNGVSSMLIDYQLTKAANPVYDILFMISTCTSYESRKAHFYEWVDYYHNELDKSLSNFGLKSNFIYSRDQLDADLKRYAKVIFGHTLIMIGMLVLKPQEAVMMKDAMEKADLEALATQTASGSKDPETMALFKEKVEGIIDSFLDFGLL